MLNSVSKTRRFAVALEEYARVWPGQAKTIYVHQSPGKTMWIDRTFRHYCVMLIMSGGGVVEGPFGRVEVQAPFGFITRPGGHYHYGPHEQWEEYGFVYANQPEPRLLESFPERPWAIPAPEMMHPQFETMAELCRHPARDGIADQIDLLALFISVLSVKGPSPDQLSGPRQQVYQAERWLREHFRELSSLDGVAERFGLSSATFRRLWGREFPQSPWQYVIDLRLQEARRLLQYQHEMRVKEIAGAVGFEDQRHFATLYRRKFGETPSSARR